MADLRLSQFYDLMHVTVPARRVLAQDVLESRAPTPRALARLRDGVPLDETLRQIRKATRVYARRQRTWFKSEPGVSWRSEHAELLQGPGLERIARGLGL